MKHSAPIMYIFLGIISIPLVGGFYFHWIMGTFFYVFTGSLIWIVSEGKANYLKTVAFWYPAILFDKPEIIF